MFKVEVEQETDGRWIAEVPELPGVITYGASREEAVTRAQALSLRVLAERLEHGEDLPPFCPKGARLLLPGTSSPW
jgi:predicted RNase H-like HicB family nuclease